MSRGLRIGVVLDGHLVEERVVRSGPVTLGQSVRCTISVPVAGLPREHVLFGADFALRLPAGMTGRMAVGEVAARAVDGPIARGTRGKLELGELVLLVQDVAMPALAPRPRLPAAMRAYHVDRRLAAIVGLSLAAHVACAVWALTTDPLAPPAFGERAAAPERPDETIDVQLPDRVDRVDPTAPAAAAVARPPAPPISLDRRSPRARALDAADASRMASILTGADGADGYGGMSPRHPGADLAAQIADARDHRAIIGDGTRTSRADDRARIGVGGAPWTTQDPAYRPTEVAHATERSTRIQLVPGAGDPTSTLTPAAVLAKIQSVYLAGLQRCYRLAIEQDATLEGKVAIELTVDGHGRATDPSAAGLSDGVDRCIAGQIAAWHFAAPRDASGAPTDATFQISLVLRPGS